MASNRDVKDVVRERFEVGGHGAGMKRVASAGTPEILAASEACLQVTISAPTSNTGAIVVGGTNVLAAFASQRGTPLWKNGQVDIPARNLGEIWLDATVAGEKVSFSYVRQV